MSARYPLVRNLYAFATRAGVSRKPSRSGSSPSSASSFLISSCIPIFYISTLSVPVRAAQDVDTADALYRDRANIASARKAADMWAAEISRSSSPEETRRGQRAAGASFDAAWKLARVDYWLGGHAPENERRKFLENGIEAARRAITLEPNRPEGHFWLAA